MLRGAIIEELPICLSRNSWPKTRIDENCWGLNMLVKFKDLDTETQPSYSILQLLQQTEGVYWFGKGFKFWSSIAARQVSFGFPWCPLYVWLCSPGLCKTTALDPSNTSGLHEILQHVHCSGHHLSSKWLFRGANLQQRLLSHRSSAPCPRTPAELEASLYRSVLWTPAELDFSWFFHTAHRAPDIWSPCLYTVWGLAL